MLSLYAQSWQTERDPLDDDDGPAPAVVSIGSPQSYHYHVPPHAFGSVALLSLSLSTPSACFRTGRMQCNAMEEDSKSSSSCHRKVRTQQGLFAWWAGSGKELELVSKTTSLAQPTIIIVVPCPVLRPARIIRCPCSVASSSRRHRACHGN